MTIAAGFPCSDGLVLCADTQETITGYAKVNTQKMTQIETPFYNIVFTGAGDSGLIDMTVQLMDQALTQKQPNGTWKIEEVLRESLVDSFNQYIVPGFQFPAEERPVTPDLLIGLQQSSSSALYRASGATFRRVHEAQCVGTGLVLGKSLMAKFFDYGLSIAQGWLIALYVLYQAKTWVEGCGGNSDILLLSNRNQKITRIPTTDVTEMEDHFATFDVHLKPVFLAAADRNISQERFNGLMKEFSLGMLSLRGKFMEFDEFNRHLYDLMGVRIPSLDELTAPEPLPPDSSQSQKP
jgi:20S proteasome alpha/beta subunit